MNVKDYLAVHFPMNELDGGLYFDWPAGLHFELAKDIYQFHDDGSFNEEMFETAIAEGLYLLDDVMEEKDELHLVLDVFWDVHYPKTRILTDYVNNASLKYKATTEQIPAQSEDELGRTRLSVHCQKADLKLKRLVTAVCNQDFPPRAPRFTRNYKVRYPDLYIVNKTKHFIAFIYDDRGMEIVAKDFETLRSIGEKHIERLHYSRPINLK